MKSTERRSPSVSGERQATPWAVTSSVAVPGRGVRAARGLLVLPLLMLAACGSTPPPPDWQMNARSSAESASEAWLAGNDRIDAAAFARARSEVARTARPDLVARVELLRCATRVAALDFSPCAAFEALANDAAPAEQAYARYLNGAAVPADAALLPAAQRPLVGASGTTSDGLLSAMEDPQSRLIAAAVLFRRGEATPGTIAQAVNTASARGWRRPLLAWLKVQQQRAASAGAADEAARIQRRVDLLLETDRRLKP